MCHSINTEGYSLLRKGKQETNEGSKKIFLNVKGAYIWSESQITRSIHFLWVFRALFILLGTEGERRWHYHGDGPADENQNNPSIRLGSNIVIGSHWSLLRNNLWKECSKTWRLELT